MITSQSQHMLNPSQDLHGSGPIKINLTAWKLTTPLSTLTNKESAFLPEECSNSLPVTDSVDLQSLSSVESVEVSTLKLLMSVPISSVRPSRILKKMILPTQVPLPITSVITSEILPVWDPIFSVLLLSPPALPSLCPPLLMSSSDIQMPSSSQLPLPPPVPSLPGSLFSSLTSKLLISRTFNLSLNSRSVPPPSS